MHGLVRDAKGAARDTGCDRADRLIRAPSASAGLATVDGGATYERRQAIQEDQERCVSGAPGHCRVARWEFVALVGNCDENERVDIFDLAAMRSALRFGTFDADCDIQEDGRINIFDLAHVRTALRAQAVAP